MTADPIALAKELAAELQADDLIYNRGPNYEPLRIKPSQSAAINTASHPPAVPPLTLMRADPMRNISRMASIAALAAMSIQPSTRWILPIGFAGDEPFPDFGPPRHKIGRRKADPAKKAARKRQRKARAITRRKG